MRRYTASRTLGRLALGFLGATAFGATACAESLPAPFVIALVRYLSTGDFFQSYLSGVENQAAALGVELRIFDSHQKRQAPG
jgi:simple sugar transport system substrate-binding protein